MSVAAIDTMATPRRPWMTKWSRHDVCMQKPGQTDQWAKMNIRALSNLDNPLASGMKQSFTVLEQQSLNGPMSARAPGAACGDGRVDPVGNSIYSRVPARDLHGAIGNYSTNRPRRSLSRDQLRTAYSEKAREGFKYWYQERPKPTSFGRYGIGSYKTVLGLGSAPRT